MKKGLMITLVIAVLSASVFAGCGKGAEKTSADDTAQKTAETAAETPSDAENDEPEAEQATETASQMGMVNPWEDTTEEKAKKACSRLFIAPEGAENVHWSMMVGDADPSGYPGPLVQMSFNMTDQKDMDFNARAKQGVDEKDALSGMYYEWTYSEDITLAGWGGGDMKGKFYSYSDSTESAQLITWYDVEVGIGYSLSVTGGDMDGFDLQAVAEAMYPGDEEYFGTQANDFLQYQSGVSDFKDYDEIISYLEPGQGYALVDINGADEKALLIAENVFEADNSTDQASIYLMVNGKPSQMTTLTGNGSACPLRIDSDGVIYCGTNHSYETYVASNVDSIMVKDYIDDGVDSGSNEITGFRRAGNDIEQSEDYTGGKEEFDKLLAERDALPVIEFTVVQ